MFGDSIFSFEFGIIYQKSKPRFLLFPDLAVARKRVLVRNREKVLKTHQILTRCPASVMLKYKNNKLFFTKTKHKGKFMYM